ncbi:hypothetical protein ABZY68_31565 [Streptomyces sp. NPDC006482]|uniref:hypothetical protein n=1 Tax=unclassified Streptomyces TaxID=2593676 RepID=UPI0022508477|nr:hypothetical protein [Streptomyces sp. NBC_00094]MCX5392821.1 hypothetical protein [Streptomyces sp. NBC_00094]
MSAARRPLLTATAAGTLLCALWFVPSANATDEPGGVRVGVGIIEDDPGTGGDARLAETGNPDTTPYLLGGTGFLGVGAGFVALAMQRRGRAS